MPSLFKKPWDTMLLIEYSAWCINNISIIQGEVGGGNVVERLELPYCHIYVISVQNTYTSFLSTIARWCLLPKDLQHCRMLPFFFLTLLYTLLTFGAQIKSNLSIYLCTWWRDNLGLKRYRVASLWEAKIKFIWQKGKHSPFTKHETCGEISLYHFPCYWKRYHVGS